MSIPSDLYDKALAETMKSAGMTDDKDGFMKAEQNKALEAAAKRIESDLDSAAGLDTEMTDLLRTQCREQVEKMLTMRPGMQLETAQLVFQHYWP